jgi:hypothetical protein
VINCGSSAAAVATSESINEVLGFDLEQLDMERLKSVLPNISQE